MHSPTDSSVLELKDEKRKRSRPKRRELFCPAHPNEKLEGNGKKYFLHLLTAEQLIQRGMRDSKARFVINAYPVLVLSDEWIEELFCAECGSMRWCHVIRHDKIAHTVKWAPRDLWEQVAHVDGVYGNPTVSQFTSREARRHRQQKTAKGKKLFDAG